MYSELEKNAFNQIEQRDKDIKDIRRKALELEEENSKVILGWILVFNTLLI